MRALRARNCVRARLGYQLLQYYMICTPNGGRRDRRADCGVQRARLRAIQRNHQNCRVGLSACRHRLLIGQRLHQFGLNLAGFDGSRCRRSDTVFPLYIYPSGRSGTSGTSGTSGSRVRLNIRREAGAAAGVFAHLATNLPFSALPSPPFPSCSAEFAQSLRCDQFRKMSRRCEERVELRNALRVG